MAKARVSVAPKETESGLLVVGAKVEKQIAHGVKEGGKDTYIVSDEYGKEVRVYKKCPGCDDPKACAESYAKKLGLKWQ